MPLPLKKVWERNYAHLQVNSPSLSEGIGGTSQHHDNFQLTLFDELKTGVEDIPKGQGQD
jgi:hypothetical protein